MVKSPREGAPVPPGFDAGTWEDARRFYPGGLARVDARAVVARARVAPYQVLPSQMGLSQLVGSGAAVRTGGGFRVHRVIADVERAIDADVESRERGEQRVWRGLRAGDVLVADHDVEEIDDAVALEHEVQLALPAPPVAVEHGVAARGQKLRVGGPAPGFAAYPGAAMDHHHQRQAGALGPRRQGEQGRNVQTVARLVAQELLASHLRRIDAGLRFANLVQRLGFAVVQEKHRCDHVRIGGDHEQGRVTPGRHRHQVDRRREQLVDILLDCLHAGVEPFIRYRIGAKLHTQDLVAVDHQLTVDIVAGR